MTRFEMDRLHDQGLMPDWAYYQQIQKPWYVAMEEQDQRIVERNRWNFNEYPQIEQYLEDQMEEIISNKLDKLFSDFNK